MRACVRACLCVRVTLKIKIWLDHSLTLPAPPPPPNITISICIETKYMMCVHMCVCVCVCVCARACVRACARECVRGNLLPHPPPPSLFFLTKTDGVYNLLRTPDGRQQGSEVKCNRRFRCTGPLAEAVAVTNRQGDGTYVKPLPSCPGKPLPLALPTARSNDKISSRQNVDTT